MVIPLTYRTLKWFTILLAPLIIGGFEFIRHTLLLRYIPMTAGNYYITLLTLVLSFIYATWMFRTIESINQHLSEERATIAVYEERERLARVLHDSIAQTLFFLNIKLQQGQMEEARFAVSEIDHQVRQVIFNLRSLPEEGASFNTRLRRWLEEWAVITGIEIVPEISIPLAYFSSDEEVLLFGIIQEVFTNIQKHAGAKRVDIAFDARGDGWTLRIADDGTGMVDSLDRPKKYGISMMQERAARLGATFDLRNREQGGLEICLTSLRSPPPL
jgi:two-component system nitrate/nitrite sensor histidine kinase NarX